MLTCLDCGKKAKLLKRHIATEHGQTPSEYRARWNLPADYPMVTAEYAAAQGVGAAYRLGPQSQEHHFRAACGGYYTRCSEQGSAEAQGCHREGAGGCPRRDTRGQAQGRSGPGKRKKLTVAFG